MDISKYDVIVVGAGLSGIVMAEQFSSILKKKCLVIDKREHIGGNCYDYVDKETGILMNRYGGSFISLINLIIIYIYIEL